MINSDNISELSKVSANKDNSKNNVPFKNKKIKSGQIGLNLSRRRD